MPRFQQPLSPPIPDGFNRHKDTFVAFFHPAYPDLAPPLLTLAAVDVARDGLIGIDFDTAKVACGIVACNRWDDGAYFAVKRRRVGEDQNHQNSTLWTKIERPADGVLRNDTTYYFIVDKPDHRYPVVPSFDHWRFPHDALPPLWAKLSIPEVDGNVISAGDADGRSAARNRDVSCRITGCFENTEVAHVIPFSHKLWFESNQMERYCWLHNMVNTIDDETNLLLLRADVHGLFDRNRFVFIPKDDLSSELNLRPTLLLHAVLPKGSREISQHYHNRPLQPRIAGIRREHLFARFALSILCDENYKFLGGAQKYTVRLFNVEKAEQYTDELHSDAIMERSQIFPPARRARSVSPKKRKIPSTQQAEELYRDDDSNCSEKESLGGYSSDIKDRPRGRARVRNPAYYKHRSRYESGQQRQYDAQCATPMQDRPKLQHSSSPGDLSLSSTLSASSFETLHAEHALENIVDHDDTSNFAADQISSGRLYHDGDHTDTSRSPKRLRLT